MSTRTRRVGVRAVLLTTTALLGAMLSPIGLGATAAHAAGPNPELWVTTLRGDVTAVAAGTAATRPVAALGRRVNDVAQAPDGSRYLATNTQVYRVPAGSKVPAPFADGFGFILGLAVDREGRVHVGDADARTVSRLSNDGGARTQIVSGIQPFGINFAPNGDLLVANRAGSITQVTPAGAVSTLVTGLVDPVDVSVASDGDLLITEFGNSRILEAPRSGGAAVGLAALPDSPRSLAVDQDGDIYVAMHGGAILEVAPDGGSSRSIATVSDNFALAIVSPVTAQEIEFTSEVPVAATLGGSYTPAATGGASGNPVTFSITTPDVCTYDGETGDISFDHAGTCTVAADQAGGTVDGVVYADADQATQDITVAKAAQEIVFAEGSPTTGTVGGTFTPAATGGASGNAVVFTVDAASADVCTIDADDLVTYTAQGTCTVAADQAGDDDYLDAVTAELPVAVDLAATSLDLAVTADGATATVTAPAGSGTPTRSVDFTIDGVDHGSADLAPVAGQPGVATAVLTSTVPAGDDAGDLIGATYAGNETTWGGSTDTYARTNPVITAEATSEGAANAAGWYRTPVSVGFTCSDGTGTLLGACPSTFRRANTGSGFVLTRTVTTTDGGSDTVSLPLRVDTAAPVVTMRRIGPTPANRESRPIRCQAVDNRSGVDGTCAVTYGQVFAGPRGGARRSWTATATDVAGNTTSRTGNYVVNGPTPRQRTTSTGR